MGVSIKYNFRRMAFSTIFSVLTHLILIFSYSNQLNATISIYETLPIFGLPSGLLPEPIKNSTFSPKDGNFVVELEEQPCYVHLDEYLMSYDELITGTLKIGSITNLEGVRIKWHLLWLKVNEIMVDLPPNDNIYFQFGLFNNKLDVHQFQTIHSCSTQKKWIFNKQLQPQLSDLPVYAIE